MAEQKQPSPDGSKRRTNTTEWRERQQKRKTAGIFKLFAFMVFCGVLVGLGIVFKDQIMKQLDKPRITIVDAPPKKRRTKVVTPPPVKVEKKVDPDPIKIVEPPKITKRPVQPPPVDVGEEKKAQQLIADGRKAMLELTSDKRHFDFEKGLRYFQDAASLRASKETHAAAEAWVQKVPEFKLAVKHVSITDYATADTTYRLTPLSGNAMSGVKVSEDSKNFKIRLVPDNNPATQGKSVFTIPKSEIADLKKVSLDKRRATFQELLLQLESGHNPSSAEDYYDLAYLSKRLGMAEECVSYLDRAYALCPHKQLGNRFRKLVVDRTIERVSLLAAANRRPQAEAELRRLVDKILPGYEVARDEADAFRINILSKMKDNYRTTLALKKSAPPKVTAQNTRPKSSARELAAQASGNKGDDDFTVNSSSVQGKGAAAGIVAQANTEYEEGMKYYKQFRSGSGAQRNAALKKAAHHLGVAVDLYGKAIDKDPGNASLESRQQEANMIRYGCMKYLTL